MKIRSGVILLIIGILAIACIGFFIVTSTVSSPTTMELVMPRDSEKESVDQYSGVKTKLTLILLKDDKVFGYYGQFINEGRSVSLDETDKLIADGLARRRPLRWTPFSFVSARQHDYRQQSGSGRSIAEQVAIIAEALVFDLYVKAAWPMAAAVSHA